MGGCGEVWREREFKQRDGMGQDTLERRANDIGSMWSGWTTMDLVPTVVTNSRINDRGDGRLERGDGHVSGRLEDVEVGGVEQGSCASRACTAKDAATFATVL